MNDVAPRDDGRKLRRNPFVVLGIPYGTRASAALRYFVRRRREIRHKGTDSAYTLNDLNAALKRVEQAEAEPHDTLDIFRVPANPQAFRPRSGYGLLHPGPRPVPPQPAGLDAAEMEQLRQAALRELVIDLLKAHGHLIPLPNITNRRPDARDTKPNG